MYSRVALWCWYSMTKIAYAMNFRMSIPSSSRCSLVFSWRVPSVPSMIGRVRSPYASILELWYAFVDAGWTTPMSKPGWRQEEGVRLLARLVVVDPYLLLVDHSAPLLRHYVVSHPARDRVVAHHSVQCVWLQLTMWSASILAPHSTHLELRTRSAETVGPSLHLSERRREASSGSIRNDPKTWLMYEPVATVRSSRSATGSRCPVLTSRVSNASRSCLW
ncbi:Hypothetical protein GLP15_2786 [Giardia lamblia P15]|uniref:Uncharacterized protein n=1 Tax=Giardia intestinalis (strain P15) TaxID=658858 RepID=E1F1Y6_GIAIA|nr:Hypothetical protein GLP15_2786 [Giardia lamblia P15]